MNDEQFKEFMTVMCEIRDALYDITAALDEDREPMTSLDDETDGPGGYGQSLD